MFINHAIMNSFILFMVKKLFICAITTNELFDLLESYILQLDPKTLALYFVIENGSSGSKKNKLDLILRL